MIAFIRATLVHFSLIALGGWSVWAQMVYRAPQSFLTVALAVLTLAVTGLTLAVWLAEAFQAVGAARRHRRLITAAHRACALVILGFAFSGLFLFANGRFDLSDPVPRVSQIMEIAGGETPLGVSVPFTWMTLRSWDNPAREERLLLRRDERWRLWGGQPVVVLVRQGYFGVPWVSAVEPDFEKQSREILRLMPEAAGVWKDLALFHLRLGRFEEARRVAGEYAARFPHDREFPVHVARTLTSRDRFPDVVTLLAPVAARHEDADVYMLLGYALGMQGRRADGLRYLERAREMQPDNWWPHYGLGWVYAAHGDTARAVLSFERAVQLRPGLHDAEAQLARLRLRVGGQRT